MRNSASLSLLRTNLASVNKHLGNKETDIAQNLYNEYKRLQNILTSKKREFKKDYTFFL